MNLLTSYRTKRKRQRISFKNRQVEIGDANWGKVDTHTTGTIPVRDSGDRLSKSKILRLEIER